MENKRIKGVAKVNKDFVLRKSELAIRPVTDDDAFTMPCLDMELYVRCFIDDERSFVVTGQLMEDLGIEGSEMLCFATMNMYGKSNVMGLAESIGMPTEEELAYVVTTDRGAFGAANGFTNIPTLDDVCDMLGVDEIVIVPSSIHEVICLSADVSPEAMNAILGIVNRNFLNGEDWLSDHVYRFSKGAGRVEVA